VSSPELPAVSIENRLNTVVTLSQDVSMYQWWYRKYAPSNTVLEGLELEARETKKGLWVDSQPAPPLGMA